MKILCLIPARKNSSRLKKKNVLNFCGKPLFEWTLIFSKKIKFFNKIVVSTDDEKILNYKKKYPKIEFLKRPKSISKKNTSMSEVIKYNLDFQKKKFNQNFDAIVIMQPTSPLRKIKTINGAIKKFIKYKPNYLASVSKIKQTQNPKMLIERKNKNFFQKQNISLINNDKKKYYYLDGGVIFIFNLRNKKFNFSKKGLFIEVNFPENLDINTIDDFKLAAKINKL